MKKIFCLLILSLLCGCETQPVQELSYTDKKALASKMIDRCVAQGIAMNSPEMMTCANSELDREISMRESNRIRANNARLALASGLSSYGNSLQARAAANRQMNCVSRPTSSWVGGPVSQVNTTCY